MVQAITLGERGAIAAGHIVLVADVESAPVQRFLQRAEEAGVLINLTWGQRRRALIILDGGYVVLTATPASELIHTWARVIQGGYHVAE